MIDGLNPYPEYKESGLPWLGLMPEHWTLNRVKTLFREVDQRSTTGKECLLSLRMNSGLVDHHLMGGRLLMPSALVNYKKASPGQIVMNRMRASMGLWGIPPKPGLVSPDYAVLSPLQDMVLEYFLKLFKSPILGRVFRMESRGLGTGESGFLRLYFDTLGVLPVPVPPPDEQAAIVRFLDHANRKIDGFVRAKRRELGLISEMLMTTTERSLTLDGTRTVRLAAAVEVTSRPIDRHDGENYTRIGLYNRGRGIFHKSATCGAELGDSDFFWVKEGDLVISGQFAWEGAVALARATDSGCIVSHRYPVLRGRQDYLSSAVLCALLRTKFGALLLNHHSRGAAGRNRPLNASTFLKEKIPIPPISAQARIAELVDREYSVSQSVARTIQLLNEYRTRLTADIVTGKLDVREAAAKLPDLPAEAAAESSADDEMDDTETEELEA